MLPVTLSRRPGLPQLADRCLDLGYAPGRANTCGKLMTLVASALAGGCCIDDAGALRSGGTAIRDLKHGAGLNHLPSGRFPANAAWLAVQVMAHNLARWTVRIGLDEGVVTTKTLRRRLFSLAGRVTRKARQLILHLPRRWPWEIPFIWQRLQRGVLGRVGQAVAGFAAVQVPAPDGPVDFTKTVHIDVGDCPDVSIHHPASGDGQHFSKLMHPGC